MSLSPAAEEIWAILREVSKAQKETELNLKKFEQRFEQEREEDRKRREEAREEEKERRKGIDEQIAQVNVIVGRLGNKLGEFVEEMVRPAAVRLFQERGINVHEVHRNVSSQRGDDGIEVDLLVVNDGDVIAIECKSTLSIDDINEHIKRLAKLKKLLPSYASKRVLGAVTAMVLPDNVAAYAYKKGLYVIAQSGNQLLIRNDTKFVPQVW